jgi:hypothetical protein
LKKNLPVDREGSKGCGDMSKDIARENEADLLTQGPLDLIENAGGKKTLHNPMLVALIREATPNALASYAKTLGWNGKIIARLRHAAQLRRDAGKYWDRIITTETRPADTMLRFIPVDHILPATEISSHLCIAGEEIVRSNWPFFLREFATSHSENYKVYTTLDGDGGTNFFGTNAWEWIGLDVNAPSNVARVHSEVLSLEIPYDNSFSCFRFGEIKVLTKPICLLPGKDGRKYPLFYKVVIIKRRLSPQEKEEITIRMRYEYGDGPTSGYWPYTNSLSYERTVDVSEHIEFVLRVEYHLDHRNLTIERDDTFNSVFIQGRLKRNWMNEHHSSRPVPQIKSEACKEAASVLASAAQPFYERKPSIDLHRVAGRSLIQDPPAMLAPLLT